LYSKECYLVPRGCSPHTHGPGVKFYKEIWHSEIITLITQDENINVSQSTNNHQTCKAKNITWYLEVVPHIAIVQNWNSIRKYGIFEYIVPMTQDENINTCHSTNNHQTSKTKNVTWYIKDDPCTAIVQKWNSIRKCDILKTLLLQYKMRISIYLIQLLIIRLVKLRKPLRT
jgi:hypothetical protein